MTAGTLTDQALDLLFREAHTAHGWTGAPVEDATLEKIYDLMKMGPTSVNCCPLRVVFVKDKAGKEKLKPALSEGNVAQTMSAPVTAILAHDLQFFEHLPVMFPALDAKPWFTGNAKLAEETAFRNGSLQAGYFILAARACGVDCGPMSGFDADKVNAAFFPDGKVRVNFLCNLGHADPAKIYPRGPRFGFRDVCSFA